MFATRRLIDTFARAQCRLALFLLPMILASLAKATDFKLHSTLKKPIPWGQIAFTRQGYLLLPVAQVVSLSEEELRRERERRRRWLDRPTEEQVNELVQREPGEDERSYRLRRSLAELYLRWLKANPQVAMPKEIKRARKVELLVVKPSLSGLDEVARIPLWEGDIDVVGQISHFGGRIFTKDMTNLWAGAIVGKRWIAAWARIFYPRQRYDVTILVNAQDFKQWSLLGEMHPLCWIDEKRLLVSMDKGGKPTLVELRLGEGGKVQEERLLAPSPSSRLSATVVPETNQVLIKRAFVFHSLDLETGSITKAQQGFKVSGQEIKIPMWTNFLIHDGHLWVVDRIRSRLYSLVPSQKASLRIIASWSLPRKMGEDFWDGPLLALDSGLVLVRERQFRRSLGRRATSGTSTGWGSLWLFDPKTSHTPQPLPLPDIRIESETQPAALSPDGLWLALRVDEQTLQVWMVRK